MQFITVIALACFFVYMVTLLARIVKALEYIADKTDKTSRMLEKMVDKLEGQPGSLPPAE